MMKIHKNSKNLTDIEDISKYLDEAINDLLIEPNQVIVELTLNKLSEEYKIGYQILKDKYTLLKTKSQKEQTKNQKNDYPKKEKINQYDNASISLIYYMLRDSKIISLVEHNITYFPNTEIRALSNEIISYFSQES